MLHSEIKSKSLKRRKKKKESSLNDEAQIRHPFIFVDIQIVDYRVFALHNGISPHFNNN